MTTTKERIISLAMAIAIVAAVAFIWSGKTNSVKSEDEKVEPTLQLQPGSWYQKTTIIDANDPFSVPRIDTVLILDKKSGYVKWALKDWTFGDTAKSWSSSEEKFFSKGMKKIK
jgi:hypothetical protein